MLTLSLGLHFKIGKHPEALQWSSPLSGGAGLGLSDNTLFECVDADGDGVCDQWDRCLDTPAGVRVDGSGCSLDSDGDGVPDSEDKCPTIPGPPTNGGCPEKLVQISGDEVAILVSSALEGVEFDYDSDRIREVSYGKLDNAAEVLKANPNYKFYVEGHTDAAGGVEYNQKLSERRAASVIRYLSNKGVNTANLTAVGKGKSELKHVECNPVTNCPAWKNLENRRVIFKEIK
nr:OmpA family protein [Faecalibacter bovis]